MVRLLHHWLTSQHLRCHVLLLAYWARARQQAIQVGTCSPQVDCRWQELRWLIDPSSILHSSGFEFRASVESRRGPIRKPTVVLFVTVRSHVGLPIGVASRGDQRVLQNFLLQLSCLAQVRLKRLRFYLLYCLHRNIGGILRATPLLV